MVAPEPIDGPRDKLHSTCYRDFAARWTAKPSNPEGVAACVRAGRLRIGVKTNPL